MSQMRLITDSRDEWTLKELLETLHAKVNALELKLDAQLASPEAVVPNEDEAMPVVEALPALVADLTSPANNESIEYPKWLQDINREARYLAAEAEIVWQQMEAIRQSRTGKDRNAYVTRTIRDKASEFADFCQRSNAKRQEYDRARKEYQTNGNK